MKTNNPKVFWLLSFLCLIALLPMAGCKEREIKVEIHDSIAREKYEEILKKKGFVYTIESDGSFVVSSDHATLEKEMVEYEQWATVYFGKK